VVFPELPLNKHGTQKSLRSWMSSGPIFTFSASGYDSGYSSEDSTEGWRMAAARREPTADDDIFTAGSAEATWRD